MIAAAPRGESGSAGERGRRSTSTGAGVRSAEQILDAVRAIPPGFVCTYGDLAPGSPRVGAVLLSPFIKPGTVSATPYNHYSSLASWESLFGLRRLADAASAPHTFGADVFTAAN